MGNDKVYTISMTNHKVQFTFFFAQLCVCVCLIKIVQFNYTEMQRLQPEPWRCIYRCTLNSIRQNKCLIVNNRNTILVFFGVKRNGEYTWTLSLTHHMQWNDKLCRKFNTDAIQESSHF